MEKQLIGSRTSKSRVDKDLRQKSADRGVFARELISLANLVGAPVMSSDGKRLGRVGDVIARWREGTARPVVVGVLTKVGRGTVLIDIADATLSQASVKVDAKATTRVAPGSDGDHIALAREVMDHQIVDTDGVQVVRSSDVYLAATALGWEVGGIDVGMWSLARRLLPRRHNCPAPDRAIDWIEIEPLRRPSTDGAVDGAAETSLRLGRKARGLQTLKPTEVAALLQELDRSNQAQLIALTSTPTAAEALKDLDASKLRALLGELDESDRERLTAMLPTEARQAVQGGGAS